MNMKIMNIENLKRFGKVFSFCGLFILTSGIVNAKSVSTSNSAVGLAIHQVEQDMVQRSRQETAETEILNKALQNLNFSETENRYGVIRESNDYFQTGVNLELDAIESKMYAKDYNNNTNNLLLSSSLENSEFYRQPDRLWSATEIAQYLNVVDQQIAKESWNESAQKATLHQAIQQVTLTLDNQRETDSAETSLNQIPDSAISLMVDAVNSELDWDSWMVFSNEQILATALTTIHSIKSIRTTLTSF